MATKTHAETPTVDPAPETPTTKPDLATVQAQRKALEEQIRALKAERKATSLQDEIQRQLEPPNQALVFTIQAAVRLRVKHGQPFEETAAGIVA